MPDRAPLAALPATRINPAILLWLFAAFGFATLTTPADIAATIHHLRVPDPDDAMRLVEARDLADGQSWFDLVQRRFGPPAGIVSHWSRLVDAPLAGLILLLTPLVGRAMAVGLAAAFWPIALFGLYALVLMRGTRAVFGARAGLIALVIATQTIGVTVQFSPGRVDHHGLQLTIVLGMALALMRGSGPAGLIAGVLAAASMAIGLEGLPYVAAAALFLCGDWVLRGRAALGAFTRDAAYLMMTLAPILMFATPVFWTTEGFSENVRLLMYLNILTGFIEIIRDITVLGILPPLRVVLWTLFLSVATFYFGFWFFRRQRDRIADVI